MSLNSQISTNMRNLMVDAITAQFNSGYIKLYDGAQPAGPGTAITTQTLIATLRFGATAFGASANGVATANAITDDTNAVGGTPTWVRTLKSDNSTALMDGTAGTASTNVVLASGTIGAGATVSISSFTLTQPAAGS